MDTSLENVLYIDLFQDDIDRIIKIRKDLKVNDKELFSQLRINHVVEYASGNPESSTMQIGVHVFGEDENGNDVDQTVFLEEY